MKISSRFFGKTSVFFVIALCSGIFQNDVVRGFSTTKTTTRRLGVLSNKIHVSHNKVMTSSISLSSSALYEKNPLSSLSDSIDLSSITSSLSDFDFEQVIANVKGDSDDLGSRGEYYFVVQIVLIASILIGGLPFVGPTFQAIGGPGLLLGGLVVSVKSLADLKSDSLSPFASPPQGGTLKTNGIYATVRHPMYLGLLMIMTGLSIATNSADRLLLTAVLWYFLEVKSEKEEDFLLDTYGPEYAEYKTNVPGKFLPPDLLDDMPWNQK